MYDPNSTIGKGRNGESLALQFLIDKGFRLREKNYRYKRGEIDLIVQKENLIVFVEAKFRKSDKFGHPEEFVSVNQQELIIRTADDFIEKTGWKGNIRFDIIAIKGNHEIEHFEDAFY